MGLSLDTSLMSWILADGLLRVVNDLQILQICVKLCLTYLSIDTELPKSEHYAQLAQQLGAVLSGETNMIANAANMSALVFNNVPDLNWSGFYLFDGMKSVFGAISR